jgi:GNAT superfamily N-acetyltransferase
MRIEQFDPVADTGKVQAYRELYAAAKPVDDPDGPPPMSPRVFAGWFAMGWVACPRQTWAVTGDDGTQQGGYLLELPDRDNRHQGWLHLVVAPARRREGIGATLLRHAAGRARDCGRSVLIGEARETSAGEAFAVSAGATHGLTEVRRMLDLAAIPADQLSRLRSQAELAAGGYVLLSWDGPVPEKYLEQVAAINGAMADAPHDADHESLQWDAQRIRDMDRRVELQGLRHYSMAAQSAATGELAGLTDVSVDPEHPTWGYQELTAVTRPHRGHRLGLLTKVAMLELLAEREPQLERVVTGNADSNKHMIAINEALGYQVLDRWSSLQLSCAALDRLPG